MRPQSLGISSSDGQTGTTVEPSFDFRELPRSLWGHVYTCSHNHVGMSLPTVKQEQQQIFLWLPKTSLGRCVTTISDCSHNHSEILFRRSNRNKKGENLRSTCGPDHPGTSRSSHNPTESNSGIKSLPNSAIGTHSMIDQASEYVVRSKSLTCAKSLVTMTQGLSPDSWPPILHSGSS